MIRKITRVFALLTLAFLLGPACSSRPIGMAAQAGSTIAIAVAGEMGEGANISYGWTANASQSNADPVRGTFVFQLWNTTPALVASFDPVLVTRIFPDPASDAGIYNVVDAAIPVDIGISQVIAIAKIPTSVGTGSYTLKLARKDASGAAIANSVTYSQPLSIVGGTGTPTPLLGTYPFPSPTSPSDFQSAPYLKHFYPHPKLVLGFPDPAPFAAKIVLLYPTTKIQQVLSVFEEQHTGRGSIVSFYDEPSAGRVTINFSDPLGSVRALSVAVKMATSPSVISIAPTEFTVQSASLYDQDGVLVSAATVTRDAIR